MPALLDVTLMFEQGKPLTISLVKFGNLRHKPIVLPSKSLTVVRVTSNRNQSCGGSQGSDDIHSQVHQVN